MNLKAYFTHLGKTLLFIFLTLLLLSTIYYFNFISSTLMNYLKPLFLLIVLFISSYQLGKKVEKNGYLEGIKLGGAILFLFLLLSLAFWRDSISIRIVLYDIILLFTSVLGSMIGINKNQKRKR